MNIKQAKEYIKNAVKLYLKKNAYGEYKIPVVHQRPVFLLGAPGIGKTAIMEQIAQELGIALVSYSMTHHTRQSALGLPMIVHKNFEGMDYDVSEYTMSEIIASVYEVMDRSGIKEGILFLDEINCVSETLAPSMLQFLQYKVFGQHSVPEGWVIVTAGNPPEYNRSVRDFDVVTLDRLRLMEVDADYHVWREYAQEKGIHNAVLNFLDLKKEYFYKIETTVKGRSYVTARGWEDLSSMLFLYEEEGLLTEEGLVGQYLRNDRVVKEFCAYYDLYNKYKKDYQIEAILRRNETLTKATERAKAASFDERLSLLGMLQDKILGEMKEHMEQVDVLNALMPLLKALKKTSLEDASVDELSFLLKAQITGRQKLLDSRKKANTLSEQDNRLHRQVLLFLEQAQKQLTVSDFGCAAEAFSWIKDSFERKVAALENNTNRLQNRLHNLFVFIEEAFEGGNEMVIFVTSLTVSSAGTRFLSAFGSSDYSKYNQELMLSERQSQLNDKIAALKL